MTMRPSQYPLGGVGRAVIGAAVMALALGVGAAVGNAATDRLNQTGFVSRLLPALLCSVIAVPIELALRSRWDHRSLAGGSVSPDLVRAPARSCSAPGVTLGSAAAVLGADTAAGWLRWDDLDPAALVGFVLTNGLVTLLLQALPEELTFRGYVWTSLREHHRWFRRRFARCVGVAIGIDCIPAFGCRFPPP